MIKKLNIFLIILMNCLLLTGCVGKLNKPLPNDFLQTPHEIIVARAKPPKASFYQEGNQGLLDVLIANQANNELINVIEHSKTKWYVQLQQNFYKHLNDKGFTVSLYPPEIDLDKYEENRKGNDYSSYDLSTLRNQIKAQYLLLIKADALGTIRSYYGFIPLGAPQAYCSLSGELINMTTGKVLWRYQSTIKHKIDEPWDQPGQYTNFKLSFKQASQMASENLLNNFLGTETNSQPSR